MSPFRRLPSRSSCTALVVAFGLLLTACADTARPDGDDPTTDPASHTVDDREPAAGGGHRLHVVATTSILGDVVAQLVRNDADLSVIMPPGADPHGFEPSARDGATLRGADLVVANGLRLETSLTSVLDVVEQEGGNVLEVAEALDPLETGGDDTYDTEHHGSDDADAEDDGSGDGHGHIADPHVWFDPVRMADGVRLIAAEIAALDTALHDDEWAARADAYAAELQAVHEEMEAMFATIAAEDRVLVTNHDSLGYLAARYDFEVVGTVIPGSSTQADVDPRGFSELVAAVEEAGVPAVFAEHTDQAALAEQLANEVAGRGGLGVEVVNVHTGALGPEGSGAETYLGLLRTTAAIVTEALDRP